ncbi:MAG: AAA family ATPase [Bacteroidota bacterium]|nr:AAA family ATPase [Bacteroidota bacterium]
MENSNEQKVINANGIFDNGFLCGKSLYLYRFKNIPSANYIGSIDGEKAFYAVKEKFGHLVVSTHTYRYYDARTKNYDFNDTFMIMQNECVMEFDTNYCEIYHNGSQNDFIEDCTLLMKTFKERQRRKPLEINLISRGRTGFEFSQIEVKRTRLDLDLFYGDDFKEVNDVISKRLGNDKDKGIVLLHGLPGTGKTTYLRYLIGKIKKRVLFMAPAVAGEMMNPDFIQLLISNPNTVLIIEDAENVIMDRKVNANASVSNLLNISDGLLADFLNVQLICTFNSPLTMVDSALMRKGRLIARYEFGKLGVEKARRLSAHFGFDVQIDRPMTIAEIANPNEKTQKVSTSEVVGFKRQEVTMN